MPTVKIQTALSSKDYRRFREKAQQLNMTEYELAQEAIRIFLNDFENSMKKSVLLRFQEFLDWIDYDIKHTF